MSALKSECRKFSPNVFNKTKCQNCFRTKEAHSAEALENNRASRNVSKCGYLFVAPDWDFNVSVNRTKRWQRRWFKLFDDGELTYALDEFPDTIPQGTIDMNKVLDVSDAESLTGNEFAVAITTPEKVHFIKGTSKEESKWWFDALSRVLPRHLSRGKHKRNATFPCGKAIIPPSNVISQDYSEDDIRLKDYSRPKFLSTSELNHDDEKEWNLALSQEDEVFCAKDDETLVNEDVERSYSDKNVEVKNALNNIISESVQMDCEEQSLRIADEKYPKNKEYFFDENNLSTHRRNRRYLKRENRVQRNQRSRFDGVSKMIPSKKATDKHSNDPQDSLGNLNSLSAIAASEKLEYLESIQSKEDSVTSPSKETAEDDSSSTDTIGSVRRMNTSTPKKTNLRKSESLKNIRSESHSEMRDQVTNLRRYHSFRGSYSFRKQKPSTAANQKRVKLSSNSFRASKDSSAARVEHEGVAADTSNEGNPQGVFMKTGWILRQTLTKEWSKHWFVLKDSTLTYYRDPSAEHCGIMDGILDLNQVSSIRECESDRHCAFCLLMWDGKKHILAAETEEMRFTWIQAIQYATNLWSSESKEDFIKTEIILPEHNYSHSDRISSPSSLISLQSLEEDGPAESSSSDDQSEYFSIVDEDEDTSCSNYHDDDLDMILSLHNIINENNLCYSSTNSCHSKETYSAGSIPDSNHERLSKSEEDMTETEFSEADTYYGKIKSEDVFGPYSEGTKSEDGCYTCSKFRSKLIAAKEEIRKLREELREAHSSFDNLEMFSYKIQQDMKIKEQSYESQIALMTAKIDDLTGKFTIAERNYRQLKQKVAKDEYKQEKRKSSLKNKDVLSLSKEYESKLSELEVKMTEIESSIRKGSSDAESEASSSQETNEIVEQAHSPSKHQLSNGLFARLQSLGARVKTVDEKVSEQSQIVENNSQKPKICVQVRDSEGSSSFDDSDDWRTVTLTKNGPNGFSRSSDEIPKTFSDLERAFTQKLHSLFHWFKSSLSTISSLKFESEENEEKCKLITCVNEVLDVLYSSVPEDIKSSESRLTYYFVLLFSEVSNVFERINSASFIDSLLKLNVADWSFSVISKLLCNIFISDKKSDISGIIRLTTEIPQLKRFCPLLNKLLHSTNQESLFSTCEEKLSELKNQHDEILELCDKAKNKRFIALWDTLSDVPVQDDADNSKKVTPMLRYITSIASSVFQTAEMQLCSLQSQSLHILKAEYDVIHLWCLETHKALSYTFQTFLVDLKERCPMINELTVPISELSTASHTEITSAVLELSFLYIASVVFEIGMSFILENKNFITSDSVPHEKWITQLKRNYSTKTNFFVNGKLLDCSQCIVLNAILSQTKIEAVDNSNDHYCEPKPVLPGLQFETENYLTLSTCASCLNNFTENMLNKKSEMEYSNRTCSQCERLQVQLNVLEKEHQSELNSLANNFRNELDILEERLQSNNEEHEQALRKKEDELESTVSELQRLKSEYEDKIQNFKNLYEQKLRLKYDNIEDNTICEIYKREIEDVKDMFKKGLVAIENSHNRITSEMEKRHKDEVALLNAEKQKALELEAEATLKALEAIKKSHAKQLKEEKTSIKEELMNKLQIDGQYESFYQKYGNELQELKAEILHITDLYSEKCLENVALEEKVNSLRQQLQDAHNELYELLIRNRDLDLHLSTN